MFCICRGFQQVSDHAFRSIRACSCLGRPPARFFNGFLSRFGTNYRNHVHLLSPFTCFGAETLGNSLRASSTHQFYSFGAPLKKQEENTLDIPWDEFEDMGKKRSRAERSQGEVSVESSSAGVQPNFKLPRIQNLKELPRENGYLNHGVPSVERRTQYLHPKEQAELLARHVNECRQWNYTDQGKKHFQNPSPGVEFTLMSYNILAQNLLEDNYYLYQHCPNTDILEWEYRSKSLIREIQSADTDIFCLQELEESQFVSLFKPVFKNLGYQGLYKKRTGGKSDGCAIFFKENVFELESCVKVEYKKPSVPLLDRDNVGLIVLLRPKSSNGDDDAKLCVATTHLLFNPRRGDIKLSQLRLLMAEIDKLALKTNKKGKPVYHPVIICGDMNSEPYSPLYRFVNTGRLKVNGLISGNVSGQYEGRNRGNDLQIGDFVDEQIGISQFSQYNNCCSGQSVESESSESQNAGESSQSNSLCEGASDNSIRHRLNLASVYSHMNQRGLPEVTTQHTRASSTVDYIFYSVKYKDLHAKKHVHIKEGPLKLLGQYGLLSDKDVRTLGGLPNAHLSSDHLCLIAKFLLKFPSES